MMTKSSICRPNLTRLGCPRWPWLLLAPFGCMQWPSPEHEGWLLAAAKAPAFATASDFGEPDRESLASTSSAQSLDEATDSAGGGVSWQARLGSAEEPLANATLAASAGVIFVAGTTSLPSTGAANASLTALSSSDGSVLWTDRLESTGSSVASATASSSDRVLIAGQSSGALGGPAQGFGDAFVAAYSVAGEQLWARQLGGASPDAALGVSFDPSGAALVVGETRSVLDGAREGSDRDAFLAKLDADGALVYTRQLGSDPGIDEIATSVAASASGDIVLAGYTFGGVQGETQGSADAFVARYSGAGDLLWTAQLGSEAYDIAEAVTVDADGATYVAGLTRGSIARGGVIFGGRPLLAKYSATGERLWTIELEDAEMGAASAVAVDARGDVWIAGRTAASFAAPNQGAFDSFVARFSADGTRSWAQQPGLADNDRAAGLALDGEQLLLLSRATQSGETVFDYAMLSVLETDL